jgi:hypothetical protein
LNQHFIQISLLWYRFFDTVNGAIVNVRWCQHLEQPRQDSRKFFGVLLLSEHRTHGGVGIEHRAIFNGGGVTQTSYGKVAHRFNSLVNQISMYGFPRLRWLKFEFILLLMRLAISGPSALGLAATFNKTLFCTEIEK